MDLLFKLSKAMFYIGIATTVVLGLMAAYDSNFLKVWLITSGSCLLGQLVFGEIAYQLARKRLQLQLQEMKRAIENIKRKQ